MVSRLLQPFYTLYVIVIFCITIVIAIPFFITLGLIRTPRARKAAYHCVRIWSVCWLWLIGMPLRVSGKVPAGRYIYVANHISYLDALLLFAAIPHHFRPLGKKEIAHIPVIGFIYKQVTILVDRSRHHSRTRSMKLMWHVLRHECSIAIFPEGTFNETGDVLKPFYDGAFRLAVNTETDIVPLLFPDTVKRWHYKHWWQFSPGINRAIFLSPIPVSGRTLADVPALKEEVYQTIYNALAVYK
jgi:1-acyl-sn-glycerol-3-phosphate acyltransferase